MSLSVRPVLTDFGTCRAKWVIEQEESQPFAFSTQRVSVAAQPPE